MKYFGPARIAAALFNAVLQGSLSVTSTGGSMNLALCFTWTVLATIWIVIEIERRRS